MAKPKPPYLAVLRWHDAYGKQEQVYAEAPTDHAPLVVETAGWISRADDIGVTIYSERITNGDGTFSWRGHGFIPQGMVVEISPFVTKKARKPARIAIAGESASAERTYRESSHASVAPGGPRTTAASPEEDAS